MIRLAQAQWMPKNTKPVMASFGARPLNSHSDVKMYHVCHIKRSATALVEMKLRLNNKSMTTTIDTKISNASLFMNNTHGGKEYNTGCISSNLTPCRDLAWGRCYLCGGGGDLVIASRL
jgi:hypothetical protein